MRYFKFNKYYFLLTLVLFVTEVFIARYIHDSVIRPFGGDFLVVILLYCLVKSFFKWPVLPVAAGVLVFAYAVEVSQYFHLIYKIGWQHSLTARLILGTTFSFSDLAMYTLGIGLVLLVENLKQSMENF